MEAVETIQDSRMEFSRKIKMLKSTQPEIKLKLENPKTQLGNSRKTLQIK